MFRLDGNEMRRYLIPMLIVLACLSAVGCNPQADKRMSDEESAQSQAPATTSAEPTMPAEPVTPADTTQPAPVKDPPPRLKVIGTEPFWGIEVEGGRLHFTTPEDQAGQTLQAEFESVASGGWRWRSQPQGAFELIVQPGECSDGMSDRSYAYTAKFSKDATRYSGCADLPEKFSGERQQP